MLSLLIFQQISLIFILPFVILLSPFLTPFISQTFFTQSFWITFAPSVLPLLLAQILPGLINSYFIIISNFFYRSPCHACAHCTVFPTAADLKPFEPLSFSLWLIIFSNQLRIFGLVNSSFTNYLILIRLLL